MSEPGYGACSAEGDCITCGDVAVPLTVVSAAAGGADAVCRDDGGRAETVATDFVGPVGAGDRLLVHAGVAIEVIARAGAAASAPDAPHPAADGGPAPQPADARPQTGDRDAVRG